MRTPDEIMADAYEVLSDPTLSDDMRAELVDAMRSHFPAVPKYTGPSIAGVTMVPNPDGVWLVVGPIEGDAVKEQILADFVRQLEGLEP